MLKNSSSTQKPAATVITINASAPAAGGLNDTSHPQHSHPSHPSHLRHQPHHPTSHPHPHHSSRNPQNGVVDPVSYATIQITSGGEGPPVYQPLTYQVVRPSAPSS